jgi:hypothetical protein
MQTGFKKFIRIYVLPRAHYVKEYLDRSLHDAAGTNLKTSHFGEQRRYSTADTTVEERSLEKIWPPAATLTTQRNKFKSRVSHKAEVPSPFPSDV